MKKTIIVCTLALSFFLLMGCGASNEPSKEALKKRIYELERQIYELEGEIHELDGQIYALELQNEYLADEIKYLEKDLESAKEETWYAEEYAKELEQLLEDNNIEIPNKSHGEGLIEKPME